VSEPKEYRKYSRKLLNEKPKTKTYIFTRALVETGVDFGAHFVRGAGVTAGMVFVMKRAGFLEAIKNAKK
jgi:hypothetical protein